MMTYFDCCGAPPPSKYERRYRSGEVTVEGDLEQLKGDSVQSDSLSVCQRADGVC